MWALAVVALLLAMSLRLKPGVELRGLQAPLQLAVPVIALATLLASGGIATITDTLRPRAAGGLHPFGLGLDFTIQYPREAPEVVRLLRLLLGPSYDVLDEYRDPSANATAGHIHIEYDPSKP